MARNIVQHSLTATRQLSLATALAVINLSQPATAQPAPATGTTTAGAPTSPTPPLAATTGPGAYANRFDRAYGNTFAERERDWRNGAVVYQVLVDRFAPSLNLEAKRHLYPAPKTLKPWTAQAVRGTYREDLGLWSHEIDFWGGDLASLRSKLGYVQGLGTDVLYLNPIHLGYTNHKYDSLDFNVVSPEFGSRDDLRALIKESHSRGMKVVLDGVFNHMGQHAEIFKQAKRDPSSPFRDWFNFSPKFEGGARTWYDAQNLPELNLENPKVREHIYAGRDSVVRSYLRDGADGWRLDVAYDIGFNYLEELRRAAHEEKPGSLVVGEVANYPKEWFPSLDGVMNFTLTEIIISTAKGLLPAATSTRMVERMVTDVGIENMLKSWVLLDNHDTDRIATTIPQSNLRRLAQILQFTLPGAPNLYYGSEIDMTGGEDPAMRSPMAWDQVRDDHPSIVWTKQLIKLRKDHRALRIGDFRPITSTSLMAFERHTDRVEDTILVFVNPSDKAVTETVMHGNSKLMDGRLLVDVIGKTAPVEPRAAMPRITLPPYSFLVLKPVVTPVKGYTGYKRVQ